MNVKNCVRIICVVGGNFVHTVWAFSRRHFRSVHRIHHFPTRTIHSLVLSFSPIYIDFFRMHYVAHCIQRYTSCKLRPPKQHIDIYTIHSFILYTIFQWRSNDTNVATVGPFEYGDTFYSSYRVLEPKIKLDRSAKASWVVFEFINCISFRQKFSRTG